MKIDVFPLLTVIFLSLIVNPLALSARAEVGNKMTLMNAYLINGDGNLLSKSVDKNTAGVTDPPAKHLNEESSYTLIHHNERLFVEIGYLDKAYGITVAFKERESNYNITISVLLVKNSSSGHYDLMLAADLTPNRGKDLKLADVFLLNKSSTFLSEMRVLQTSIRNVAEAYRSSNNETIRLLGKYYNKMVPSFDEMLSMIRELQGRTNLNILGITVSKGIAIASNSQLCDLVCELVILVVIYVACVVWVVSLVFCVVFAPVIVDYVDVICGVICYAMGQG
jgi:hypothetical protein